MLKGNTISTHMTNKIQQATAVAGVDHEDNAKLNWDTPSQARIVHRVLQKSSKHPANPVSLEDLYIPPVYLKTHFGDNLLIWHSYYSHTLCRASKLIKLDYR
ncbi:unnamed protein product [Lepeophtheirus salmonis]|uniref:(salmon louse) hypothetical protein n=1 Tax=Lepeophtheirus salmonis TaxID=72036 RepID=A0A7R8D762_LEPSM|nr:unnamed protein product [Lepeophtheirus salmonis]CAF3023117.1 unnamed protein product [Lepeophtheirus salmonis]